jgi:hypothetical protein
MNWLRKIKSKFLKDNKRQHVAHLSYVMERLQNPKHIDMCDDERSHKIAAVRWLLAYHTGHPNVVKEGPPEKKLEMLLTKPIGLVEEREYVVAGILYYWIKYKRIRGF